MLRVKDIKEIINERKLTNNELDSFRKDNRISVKKLIARYEAKIEREEELYREFLSMQVYENDLRNNGKKIIAGIDEVGRGPLAGPVFASAVVLGDGFYCLGINDSKKLSAKKREEFFYKILDTAEFIGVGYCTPNEIDEINIYNASKLAMKRALDNLGVDPDHLLVDALELSYKEISETSIIKGDSKSISIAAASIVAKVIRDKYMASVAEEFPQYGFERNAGYGTKDHVEAINRHGITEYHRKTFEPIKSLLNEN